MGVQPKIPAGRRCLILPASPHVKRRGVMGTVVGSRDNGKPSAMLQVRGDDSVITWELADHVQHVKSTRFKLGTETRIYFVDLRTFGRVYLTRVRDKRVAVREALKEYGMAANVDVRLATPEDIAHVQRMGGKVP